MSTTTMKNSSQARAKFAWECANKSGNDTKEYGSVVGKIPTYVKTNGLLNTLAFLYSKSSTGKNGEVLKNICQWLSGQNLPQGVEPNILIDINILPQGRSLEERVLNYLLTANTGALIACTSEVLALFNWLRRFAKSE